MRHPSSVDRSAAIAGAMASTTMTTIAATCERAGGAESGFVSFTASF
jgi:hypothetical protein